MNKIYPINWKQRRLLEKRGWQDSNKHTIIIAKFGLATPSYNQNIYPSDIIKFLFLMPYPSDTSTNPKS